MIRGTLLAPLALFLRRRVRGPILAPVEYLLYVLGWLAWLLDWLLRLPDLAREATLGADPRSIRVRGAALVRPGAAPDRLVERARGILEETRLLLEPLRLTLVVESVDPLAWPDRVPPPACGLGALVGGFFAWASARSGAAPLLTVYFVEDLGRLSGCAVPGADWVVVDGRTDGSTVAHELGHLADLWRHDPDPDNLMTDRPGGAHARITGAQAALIRTSRFAVPLSRR